MVQPSTPNAGGGSQIQPVEPLDLVCRAGGVGDIWKRGVSPMPPSNWAVERNGSGSSSQVLAPLFLGPELVIHWSSGLPLDNVADPWSTWMDAAQPFIPVHSGV